MADPARSTPDSGSNDTSLAEERPFDVARIDHVVLRCRDVNAMVEFYCTLLGLEVAKRNERLGLVHLRAGSAMIDLVPASDGQTGEVGLPLPVPPLDGGNVLAGLLRGPAAEAFDRLRPYGFLIIYGLLLTGILWAVIGPIESAILSFLI